ncbi:hypothetical protein MES4922_310051 [Mesorhizobium ventifaucium]|uniref:Uncharacterized protein n=1 Tax=Mesorhizobium ventifaucium TaxID=666020 RepID=A0ABM9E3L8_9HYPH|nr:hypothetical protein MES4922_310051 [Mesorhizobium ventifaucium]
MAPMQMLHCTIVMICLYCDSGRTNQGLEPWVFSLKCSLVRVRRNICATARLWRCFIR